MKFALSIFLTFFCMTAFASPYYFANPYSPYPPGCITTPRMQQTLANPNVVEVWSDRVLLAHAYSAEKLIPMDLTVYRMLCAESNRSVILMEFSIPHDALPDDRQFVLPEVVALGDELLDEADIFPMTLATEPNSWGFSGNENREVIRVIGDFTDGMYDASQYRWVYVLDVAAPPLHWEGEEDVSPWFPSRAISAPRYNDHVGLRLHNGSANIFINIPPTELVLNTGQTMELNGRLSGNWAVVGADDQGLMLSISSLVGRPEFEARPESAPLLVFLSWYTFDAQSQMLWLTGAAEFQPGATEALISLVYISNGHFMSPESAHRSFAGTVRLKANSCNNIRMDYELNNLGLGAGTQTLQRIFALEIAGFPCRDYDARLADLVAISTRGTQP